MAKKKNKNTDKISEKQYGLYVTLATFIIIIGVYLLTLNILFPNLPVIARKAEEIPGYDEHYPPFRVDEHIYHTIAENLLNGNIYEEDSLERAYSVGFPFVAAPFISVLGESGGYVANSFIIWCSLIVFYLILRRYSSRAKALVLTIIMAFATLNWFYAVSCYSEPLSQLLVLFGFYLLTVDRSSPKWGTAMIWAGFITALNLFVRPHYILISIIFFSYLYLTIDEKKKVTYDKKAFLFAGGAVIVIILWMLRNAFVFGGLFTFEYTRNVADYIPGAKSMYMKGNIFLGSHRLLFDQYHGLLTITPIFLLFPVGLRSMWLKDMKKETLMLLASVFIMALFAAASTYPFTEFGLGSRHMVPVIPLMVLPCVFFLDSRLFSRSVVTVLAVYSFYHAGFGWFTGGEPGMGFFLGILNDAQSRTIILSRKGLLPKRHFNSQKELIRTFRKALNKADLMKLLQTLDPSIRERIRGNERNFMLFLRNQKDPIQSIISANPERGIMIKSFSISGKPPEKSEQIQDSTDDIGKVKQ